MPWIVLRLYALHRWLSSRTKNFTTKPVRVGIFGLSLLFVLTPKAAHAAPLWVESLVQNFAYIAYSVAAAMTQFIVLLLDVLVPIMTYNNFVGNPVVKAGWAIVRDTVNMFFVVILILIAFGTIFGAERFKWQQQVPRLLVMAIVINFSKTLCGIMIDFGQVIMLTFANALREIAAGNFIQLLQLNQIYQVSQASSIIKGIEEVSSQGASNAFDFFGSAILSVLMTFWVAATLIMLIAILLFRMVMLWILVVIAPLAWFMKGAKGIIDSNAYKDWWEEFKCLVGIGPVLAFFLWLTLAVAGAGNTAANSGFDVSTNSNNADFTSSLLEVNNFLSFLIGMAMLFAGFKAASQFCSAGVSGGFIGSQLKKGQAFPKAAALTTAGLFAKGGSLGLRSGARVAAGTPGVLAAGSRYLPPAVRNIPSQVNPLSAKRRAALSGKVGGVLGDNAVGRYFKGKQADIQQGIRATKFEGVSKEREAMKDKDRNWKQGQLEAMMKSPPMTQAGKDKETALFEEMMGDKRLQKDLGRDKVEALWKRHGAKYKDMATGNVEKTANIEGFEQANADFVLKGKNAQEKDAWFKKNLKDTDDAKGLSAGAWQNSDVQARAGKIMTNVKKGKDENGDVTYMTALEAAKAGHYGLASQEAALKGTDVTKEGSMDHMRRGVEVALAGGDKAAANKLVSQMGMEYHSSTDPAKKAEMLSVMDSTMGMLKDSKDSGAGSVLKRLSQVRDTAERVSPPPDAAQLQEGQNGEAYAEDMKHASAGRKANAVSRLTAQEVASNQEVAQTQTQRDTVVGDRKSAIQGELDALAKSLAQARTNIDKELKDKTNALHGQWLDAVAKRDQLSKKAEADKNNPQLMGSWKDESAKEAQKAAQEAEALRVQLSAARKNSDIPADRKRTVEGDDRVKKIQIEIETKANQLKNFNPEEIKEVKDLINKIASLKEQIAQIKTARDKLK